MKCRHRPIFPGGRPPSIFGTNELNYRVRNENGWTLIVIDTDYVSRLLTLIYLIKNGDPWGNRTPVTGVRGRCLNRLTNGPHIEEKLLKK